MSTVKALTPDCGGPDWCIDDLCAMSDQGICGRWSAHSMGEDCGRPECWECAADRDIDWWAS